MRTRHDNRDANEPALVEFARRLGAQWRNGPPLDGWIWWAGLWIPVEIKLPEREGLANEYTPMQKRFLSFCRDYGAKYFIWRCEDDIMRDLGARRTA